MLHQRPALERLCDSEVISEIGHVNDLDDHDIEIAADGEFEVIFSGKRPDGYKGNWAPTAA